MRKPKFLEDRNSLIGPSNRDTYTNTNFLELTRISGRIRRFQALNTFIGNSGGVNTNTGVNSQIPPPATPVEPTTTTSTTTTTTTGPTTTTTSTTTTTTTGPTTTTTSTTTTTTTSLVIDYIVTEDGLFNLVTENGTDKLIV